MAMTKCRYFNGYKPCGKSQDCQPQCLFLDEPQLSILIIHLGALGAVLRSTSLLDPIKRKYPSSRITWVTQSPAHHLLLGHPLIDRVFTTSSNDLLKLRALEFDIGYVIDKSLEASGLSRLTKIDQCFGFSANPHTGAIEPLTKAAQELWEIGLSDEKKFHQNRKTEVQLQIEALELGPYRKQEYSVYLSDQEKEESLNRKFSWTQKKNFPVIGINTGCSDTLPAKKLSVSFQRRIILELIRQGWINIVLLGGPEDTERNKMIGERLSVIQSSTTSGLRDGLISVNACDLILTGDSLGMHMGIGLKKEIIAWFGPTCAHEIELYDRGQAVLTQAACAPCWKKSCQQALMCYDQVSIEEIVTQIRSGISRCLKKSSLSKQPSLEISSLEFPQLNI